MSYPDKITKTMKRFQHFSPKTVPEAVSTLSRLDSEAKLLAGGTDLLPMMKQRVVTPGSVVNIKNIRGLAYIREDAEGLKIGALTTIADIKESDLIKQKCLSLHEAAARFGTPLVRNMATIGGNICRSAPSADMVPPLCDDIRIALGVVADKAIRAKKAEQAVRGKSISDEVIEGAAQKVTEDISPRTSARSTAWYRTEVSKVLVRRLLKLAVERIR